MPWPWLRSRKTRTTQSATHSVGRVYFLTPHTEVDFVCSPADTYPQISNGKRIAFACEFFALPNSLHQDPTPPEALRPPQPPTKNMFMHQQLNPTRSMSSYSPARCRRPGQLRLDVVRRAPGELHAAVSCHAPRLCPQPVPPHHAQGCYFCIAATEILLLPLLLLPPPLLCGRCHCSLLLPPPLLL